MIHILTSQDTKNARNSCKVISEMLQFLNLIAIEELRHGKSQRVKNDRIKTSVKVCVRKHKVGSRGEKGTGEEKKTQGGEERQAEQAESRSDKTGDRGRAHRGPHTSRMLHVTS